MKLIPKRKPEVGADGRMPLMAHLTELRNRIIICLVAIAAFAVIGFVAYSPIFNWLTTPLREAQSGLKQCANKQCELITTDFLQPFVVRLKIATYFGILFASPVIMWQIWRFITPGLSDKEKRWAIPFLASTIVLFAGGAAVAWFTLSKAFTFLISIGGVDIAVKSTADQYVTLVGLMFLAFGLSFEFPVLLMFLLLVRVLTTATLRKYRRHSMVGIVVFAAVITPSQDPFSLFLMAGPMWIFYELCIILGKALKR